MEFQRCGACILHHAADNEVHGVADPRTEPARLGRVSPGIVVFRDPHRP